MCRPTFVADAAPGPTLVGMPPHPDIRFCRRCGTATQQQVPPLEDRERAVCPSCAYIDYVNPINVVGTVPVWGPAGEGLAGADVRWAGEHVLLCRRAIEPRQGLWTLPAGFLEYGETIAEGAVRETLEEAGARIELGPLYTVLDVAHVGQVHLFFLARLVDLQLQPGPETTENRLFALEDIPWGELAFRTVARTLHHYVDDCAAGAFPVHTATVTPADGRG